MPAFSSACERNKQPILEILRVAFAASRRVLEIGSGTGQHAIYFAANMPHLLWQPTERSQWLPDLRARIQLQGPSNLLPPAPLDVNQPHWPYESSDAVFTANTLHIMSWAEVTTLLQGVGALLPLGGVLCIYGPFRYRGTVTPRSNEEFDHMLRQRDPDSGLRDHADIVLLAQRAGMHLSADDAMPAFNRMLTFAKITPQG